MSHRPSWPNSDLAPRGRGQAKGGRGGQGGGRGFTLQSLVLPTKLNVLVGL